MQVFQDSDREFIITEAKGYAAYTDKTDAEYKAEFTQGRNGNFYKMMNGNGLCIEVLSSNAFRAVVTSSRLPEQLAGKYTSVTCTYTFDTFKQAACFAYAVESICTDSE